MLEELRSTALPPEREALAGTSFGSARSLLFTLLGEYVFPQQEPVWTATLLKVLVGLGIAEKSARQAIARAASAGWLEKDRDGRRVSWQLTPKLRRSMERGIERVRSISRNSDDWDGQWLILNISLPDSHRAIRAKLYRSLRWAGFGSPTVGLWINPHSERLEETAEILRRLGLSDFAYIFRGEPQGVGLSVETLVQQSWDWSEIEDEYQALLRRFGSVRVKTQQDLFYTYFALAHEWQQLPFIDPGLPRQLLPAGATGPSSARRLEELRDNLNFEARRYWLGLNASQPSR